MSIGDRINQIDSWLLERVWQPIADRLPERWPAIDIGMSCQLGAILLSGVAIAMMIIVGHMAIGDAMFNVLVWCVGLAFFVGISRVRQLVRRGQPNPLRPMLSGMRPMSIPFALLAAWQGAEAPPQLALGCWFFTLSYVVFVIGIYLISCEQRPPKQRTARNPRRAVLTPLEGGLSGGGMGGRG
jgi:hypothetical protein